MRRQRLAGGGGALEEMRTGLEVAEVLEHSRQPLDDQHATTSRVEIAAVQRLDAVGERAIAVPPDWGRGRSSVSSGS